MSDALQYSPERCTVVATYKNLVIGVALLSSPQETYITYLAVKPGWDDAQVATTTTYSSNKIVSLLDALKTEILGGADAAYDTLVEIQQLLQNGTSGLDALLAAVNNRVRFDAAQSLTVA